MINEAKFIRCEPNDPRRCQGAAGKCGQCPYTAVPGEDFCPMHLQMKAFNGARRSADRYRLTQYQERVGDLTSDNEIKNLRAEIGILRMVLEKIINGAGDDNALICYSGKISDIIIKIKALVTTCHNLDVRLGHILERDKVMLIGEEVVKIVSDYITDPDHLEDIANRLVYTITKIADPTTSINNQGISSVSR